MSAFFNRLQLVIGIQNNVINFVFIIVCYL